MSLTRKKKAAIAAVTHYLRTEAEAARFSNAVDQPDIDQPAKAMPVEMSTPWSMGGRLHQMQLRSMMQWKAFHGCSR
jgi:hypothetical protein